MTLFRGLWISFVAALLPAATLITVLFKDLEGPVNSGGGIAIALGVLAAGAMALPIAGWGLCVALLLKTTKLSDLVTRSLHVASFAALLLLVAALPRGPDGGGGIGPAIGQGFIIGVTVLGELLRLAPLLGLGWLVAIAAAAFTPAWLGLPLAMVGAYAIGLALPEDPYPEASRHEKRVEEQEIRVGDLVGDERSPPKVIPMLPPAKTSRSYTVSVDGRTVVVTRPSPGHQRPGDPGAHNPGRQIGLSDRTSP